MNMSYCRFSNTLPDLQDCYDNLFDDDLSEDEARARKLLIKICQQIVRDTEDDNYDCPECSPFMCDCSNE